jgi:hypothetical protein
MHLLSTGFALFALFVAVRNALRMQKALDSLRGYANEIYTYARKASESAPRREMAELQGELTDLADSYAALLKSHKRLRSRIGMREVREKKANGADEPDLSDPAQRAVYKQNFRRDAKAKGLL